MLGLPLPSSKINQNLLPILNASLRVATESSPRADNTASNILLKKDKALPITLNSVYLNLKNLIDYGVLRFKG